MQYHHPSSPLRPALLLALAGAAFGARADLLGPDRFTATPAPRVGELRWSLTPASDHRVHFGAAVRRPGADAAIDPYGRGWQLGLWAEDEWRVSDSLRATGGLRMGRDDAGGRTDTPHAGLAWSGPVGLQLRAGVERGQRGAALGFERQWDGLRLKAELGVREADPEPGPGVAFGLRLASRAWWLDLGSIGASPAADPRQLRMGANFVF